MTIGTPRIPRTTTTKRTSWTPRKTATTVVTCFYKSGQGQARVAARAQNLQQQHEQSNRYLHSLKQDNVGDTTGVLYLLFDVTGTTGTRQFNTS